MCAAAKGCSRGRGGGKYISYVCVCVRDIVAVCYVCCCLCLCANNNFNLFAANKRELRLWQINIAHTPRGCQAAFPQCVWKVIKLTHMHINIKSSSARTMVPKPNALLLSGDPPTPLLPLLHSILIYAFHDCWQPICAWVLCVWEWVCVCVAFPSPL